MQDRPQGAALSTPPFFGAFPKRFLNSLGDFKSPLLGLAVSNRIVVATALCRRKNARLLSARITPTERRQLNKRHAKTRNCRMAGSLGRRRRSDPASPIQLPCPRLGIIAKNAMNAFALPARSAV
jgi:hypothetical protein